MTMRTDERDMTETTTRSDAGTNERRAGRGGRGPRTVDRPSSAGRRWRTLASQVGFVLGIGVVWQVLLNTKVLDAFWVPSPVGILDQLVRGLFRAEVRDALGATLSETLVGFAISAVAGVLTGLALFELEWLFRMTQPFIVLFNNLPRLVFAPLLVLYFGVGSTSRVIFVVISVYIVVILNTIAGLQSADSDHLRLARALGATRWQTFRQFRLPSAIPTIFVGLQIGMNLSLVSAIVSEILTGGSGLGALVSRYTDAYQFNQVFAVILVMAILGTLLSVVIRLVESYLLRWRRFEFRGLH